VSSNSDFGHLLWAIKNKKLDSLNIEFSESALHLIVRLFCCLSCSELTV
jgi:hypothetical protein